MINYTIQKNKSLMRLLEWWFVVGVGWSVFVGFVWGWVFVLGGFFKRCVVCGKWLVFGCGGYVWVFV